VSLILLSFQRCQDILDSSDGTGSHLFCEASDGACRPSEPWDPNDQPRAKLGGTGPGGWG